MLTTMSQQERIIKVYDDLVREFITRLLQNDVIAASLSDPIIEALKKRRDGASDISSELSGTYDWLLPYREVLQNKDTSMRGRQDPFQDSQHFLFGIVPLSVLASYMDAKARSHVCTYLYRFLQSAERYREVQTTVVENANTKFQEFLKTSPCMQEITKRVEPLLNGESDEANLGALKSMYEDPAALMKIVHDSLQETGTSPEDLQKVLMQMSASVSHELATFLPKTK